MYAMDNIQSSENRKISHNQLVWEFIYLKLKIINSVCE